MYDNGNRLWEIFDYEADTPQNACGRDRSTRANYIKLLEQKDRNILLAGLRIFLHRGQQLGKACPKLYVVEA